MLNEWTDIRMGDPWPTYKTIKAGDKALDTAPGEAAEQHVALWYVHGEPVMGRIWNDKGKVGFFVLHDSFDSTTNFSGRCCVRMGREGVHGQHRLSSSAV